MDTPLDHFWPKYAYLAYLGAPNMVKWGVLKMTKKMGQNNQKDQKRPNVTIAVILAQDN